MIHRAIRTHHLPEDLNPAVYASFLDDIKRADECDRPCFVLDCADVRRMDGTKVQLLLSCLEHAMKCNGDVRLAGLRPEVARALASSGADRLFEKYRTTDAAIASFAGRRTSMMPLRSAEEQYEISEENAA